MKVRVVSNKSTHGSNGSWPQDIDSTERTQVLQPPQQTSTTHLNIHVAVKAQSIADVLESTELELDCNLAADLTCQERLWVDGREGHRGRYIPMAPCGCDCTFRDLHSSKYESVKVLRPYRNAVGRGAMLNGGSSSRNRGYSWELLEWEPFAAAQLAGPTRSPDYPDPTLFLLGEEAGGEMRRRTIPLAVLW